MKMLSVLFVLIAFSAITSAAPPLKPALPQVVDSLNDQIGLLMNDGRTPIDAIDVWFPLASGRFARVHVTRTSFEAEANGVYYTGSDCTGTIYTPDIVLFNFLVQEDRTTAIGTGQSVYVGDGVPTNVTTNSRFNPGQDVCAVVTTTALRQLALEIIAPGTYLPPFSVMFD